MYFSAVKQLIASKINVCCVYLLCIYKHTHTYSLYLENIYMYLHVCIYIHIMYIINKYINMDMCIFIYAQHTCIYYVNKKTFILDAINRN